MTVAAPAVSVVIPTRDRSDLLARALRTVLAQEDVDLEVVVVDDGSRDATPEVVEALGDARLRLVRTAGSRGVSAARNHGIAEAAGEWVAFLDDDDLWAPDKLARQLDAAERAGADWVYAGAVVLDADLHVLGGGKPPAPESARRALLGHNVVPAGASNVVARRAVVDDLGGFSTDLRHFADWDLWLRLSARGAPAVVDAPLVGYVLHPGNASCDPTGMLDELAILDARYADLRGGAPIDWATNHRWIAWFALRAGRRGDAVRAYLRAVRRGDWRSLGRALIGALHPRISHRPLARHLPDPAWVVPAERWLTPLRPSPRRAPLPPDTTARIRRDRQVPRPSQWDWLHLRALRNALEDALAGTPADGPVLDLYCGTQPYRDLVRGRPLVGVDVDGHFGHADVHADVPLPFRDGAFAGVLCTQALYQCGDPEGAVAEARRVLAPGGWMVASVPHVFVREYAWERRYTVAALRALFTGWDDVRVSGVGGLGASAAYAAGRVLSATARRLPPLRRLLPVLAVPLNVVAALLDLALAPFRRRWPHLLVVVGRAPAATAAPPLRPAAAPPAATLAPTVPRGTDATGT